MTARQLFRVVPGVGTSHWARVVQVLLQVWKSGREGGASGGAASGALEG
jgi:hypothetical protein